MAWFRVDDQFHLHRKAHTAGNAALGLWLLLGSYGSGKGRNGRVPMRVALSYGTRRQLDRLINVGLVDKYADEVEVHDWGDVHGEAASTERTRRWRAKQTSRDASQDASRGPVFRRPSLVSSEDDDQDRGHVTVTQSSSSKASIDKAITIAAHAIAAKANNQGKRYIAGIERNLRAERMGELEAALDTEHDPVRAAGVVVGSHVAARNAARDLKIVPRNESNTK